jgi:hypothetical protein
MVSYPRTSGLAVGIGLLWTGFLISLTGADNVLRDKPAADWHIFRGNALQNGVASSALPPKLEILWKF